MKPGTALDRLQRSWWRARPDALARALRPLAAVHDVLRRGLRARARTETLPVPVVVVGNVVVGGAGKTPVVMALVAALRAAGWHPGVISRGYGRRGDSGAPRAVEAHSSALEVGDEPLLICRRTGAPVWVARRRTDAARALLAAHPEVDVLLSDDGLQHLALPRALEILVFDDRGLGNGLLLPAGPLREPCPATLGPLRLVLYTGRGPSTPLPGPVATRRLAPALPLPAWWSGQTGAAADLQALKTRLQGQPCPPLAVAGIAAPQKFFDMLSDAGLAFRPCPQPDHARHDPLPWPPGFTGTVLTTEKDAVKLKPVTGPGPEIWVLPLDLELPAELLHEITRRLPAPPSLHHPVRRP